MASFPLFIARRIYGNNGDRRKVSRPAIRIAILGVAIGLAVMIVTVAVVLGFKNTIRGKVAGFGSHIQIINAQSLPPIPDMPIAVGDSMIQVLKGIPGVKHVERFTIAQGILKTDSDFLGVMFKGIGPEYDTRFLADNLIEGELPQFSDVNPLKGEANSAEHPYSLVVSQVMASKLKLRTGDIVYAYFIGEKVTRIAYKICGVYQTNMKRFDDVFCITDLYVARQRNAWRGDLCSGAEILVSDFEQISQTDHNVSEALKRGNRQDGQGNTLVSVPVQQAYPPCFNGLTCSTSTCGLFLD